MSAPELTPMVLSLALALLALTGTTDGAITCEAVTTRYESTITCFFGTDIFDTKHSFNLQFYYPNLQADPETPLMCNWVTAENMECKESQGVEYNRVLADQITVKGPADPRRVGGKYVCQVLPSLDVPVKPCDLTFSDATTTTTTTTSQPIAMEDLTDKVTTTLIVSGLVLTIAVILLLIAVLFIVCTRVKLAERIRKWRMSKKKEPDGEKPEETADAGEKVIPPEWVPLIRAANAKEAPRPSSGEAGPPVVPRTLEIQPAGKEGDKLSESNIEELTTPGDAHREVAKPPAKKRSWNPLKKRPKDEKPTGTEDVLLPKVTTGDEDTPSGKGKKSGKTKEGKGKGKKELPGIEEAQQPAPTVDGTEEPRRHENNQ